jgi:hypothetical protein
VLPILPVVGLWLPVSVLLSSTCTCTCTSIGTCTGTCTNTSTGGEPPLWW